MISLQEMKMNAKIDDEIINPKLAMILQALGQASVCWESVEGAGTFKSDDIVAIGKKLYTDLGLIDDGKTTQEAFDTEHARTFERAKEMTNEDIQAARVRIKESKVVVAKILAGYNGGDAGFADAQRFRGLATGG